MSSEPEWSDCPIPRWRQAVELLPVGLPGPPKLLPQLGKVGTGGQVSTTRPSASPGDFTDPAECIIRMSA